MNKCHEPRKDLNHHGRNWATSPNAIAAPRTAASAVMLNSSDNRDKTALVVAAVHNSRSLFACRDETRTVDELAVRLGADKTKRRRRAHRENLATSAG